MFEIPVVQGSYSDKASIVERKLKYKYINELTRQYKRIDSGSVYHGMLTPDNSNTEFDEHDDDDDDEQFHSEANKKARRLRKRWRSILHRSSKNGENSDDEDEEANEEEEEEEVDDYGYEEGDREGDDHQSEERKYFSKYEKPQVSYELWKPRTKKNTTPIKRDFMTYYKAKKIEKNTRRRMETALLHVSKNNQIKFNAMIQGFTIIETKNQSHVNNHNSDNHFQDKHIKLLINLLHVNVSRQDWNLAYKIFALLIRIPKVDIRSIWHIGIKILSIRNSNGSIEFLEWMHSVFSSKNNFIQGQNHRFDPVFRSGSKDHTPQYTVAWLWRSLLTYSKALFAIDEENDGNIDYSSTQREKEDKLNDLIERLSELVLMPPYMEDPQVWFVRSMCHMVRADYLSKKVNESKILSSINSTNSATTITKDLARNQVIENIKYVQKYLQHCHDHNDDFEFPIHFIERQLKQIESKIYDNSTNNSTSSSDNDSDIIMSDDNVKIEQKEKGSSVNHTRRNSLNLQPIMFNNNSNNNDINIDENTSSFDVEEDNSFLQALDTQPLDLLNTHEQGYYDNRSDDNDNSSE